MTTCIFTADSSTQHDTGPGHPECPERIPSIINGLKRIQSKNLIWKDVGSFDEKYIKLTHSEKYLEKINQSFPKKGLDFLDGDTIVSKGSKKAAYDAVSSIINAIDAVMNKEFNNASGSSVQPTAESELRAFPSRFHRLFDHLVNLPCKGSYSEQEKERHLLVPQGLSLSLL